MMAFSVTSVASVVKSFLGRKASRQSSQSKAILAAPEAWLIALLAPSCHPSLCQHAAKWIRL